MKYASNLVNTIQKISLFFCVVMVNGIYAMDQDTVLANVNQRHKSISRKRSGFDKLTLKQLKPWYDGLSDNNKKAIYNNLRGQDKSNKALFYFTQMPEDIQKIILLYALDNNQSMVKLFYSMPLCKAVHNYPIAKKMFETGEEESELNRYLREDTKFTFEVVFEHAKDIQVFENWVNDKQDKTCLSKKELGSLVKVFDKFKCRDFKSRELQYKYYYTWEKCWDKKGDLSMFPGLPFLIAPFISALVPYYYDSAKLSQKIIINNEYKECFNLFLNNKYQETANPYFLAHTEQIIDPRIADGVFYVMKSALYASILPLTLFISDGRSGFKKFISISGVQDMFIKLVATAVVGLLSWCIEFCFVEGMPLLVGTLYKEDYFAGMALLCCAYGWAVCFYDIKKMRMTRSEKVKLKDLSELLKSADIVIE